MASFQTSKLRLAIRICSGRACCVSFGIWICSFGISTTFAADAPPPTRDPVRVDEKTEAVIKGALKWLVSKQSPNGAWAASDMEQQHPIAITGYALMALSYCKPKARK